MALPGLDLPRLDRITPRDETPRSPIVFAEWAQPVSAAVCAAM